MDVNQINRRKKTQSLMMSGGRPAMKPRPQTVTNAGSCYVYIYIVDKQTVNEGGIYRSRKTVCASIWAGVAE